MKKILTITLLILIFLSSGCENQNSINIDNNMIVILDKISSYSEVNSMETTIIDGEVKVSKDSYYKLDDDFYGYSSVCIESQNLSPYSTSEIYFYNEEICVSTSANRYYSSYKPTSIIEYMGLKEIIDISNDNNKYSGTARIDRVLNVVQHTLYELGSDKNIHNFINLGDIQYEIIRLDDSILKVVLNLTSIYREFDSSIQEAKKSFLISEFKNYQFQEFPKESTNVDDNSVDAIKQKGIDYINDKFRNLTYIRDDFKLYPSMPNSLDIKYSYSVSDTSILDLKGTYTHPVVETPMKITVDVLYKDDVYETLEYEIICLPFGDYTGQIGTLTNPLYKGKKETSTMDIYYIEMIKQYGDAIFIKSGDFDMLVDAGQPEDAGNVRKVLNEYVYDQTLECVIATHAHSDHIGGMITALNSVTNIDYVVDFGYDRQSYSTTASYRNYINNKADYYYPIYDVVKGINGLSNIVYITDDIYIDFLDTNAYIPAGQDSGGNDNPASVTFILNFKGKKFYFSGDLGASGENYLVDSGQLYDVDVMKATHHGSSNGNTTNLLNKIKPEYVVVSAALTKRGSTSSNAGSQTHPSSQALSRFYSANSKVYCNFTNGTIRVSTDGNNITINGLGVKNPYYINGEKVTGEENLEFKYTKWAKAFR